MQNYIINEGCRKTDKTREHQRYGHLRRQKGGRGLRCQTDGWYSNAPDEKVITISVHFFTSIYHFQTFLRITLDMSSMETKWFCFVKTTKNRRYVCYHCRVVKKENPLR